ncbi:hypothetical protein JOF29_002531 [Kribbella aluminosa]|uniref:Amidohydrolase-related domain-containing protein n=1 Tax=Kribbella aluminosa TaxID=416017 RepID=A0ABS4UIL1_9ACTN|nr:DUF6282 family protein [Kribbella aluminosa]MBP2351448.1 hypothetical protein [Kribbella aluminosa]
MLSWDLHVHPGSAAEGRWGDGGEVREAARRAGVKGLVWKSHGGSTAAFTSELAPGSPWVIPSIVLNPSVSPADVHAAIERGVRWIWGPSRRADGSLGWELPLPRSWKEIAEMLCDLAEPVVLATSHLEHTGRHEFASFCSTAPAILCTVTHSLYLSDSEVTSLAGKGAVFEVDLYTLTRTVRDVPLAPLAPRADLLHSLGSTIYLTSDAGQAAVGNPYVFVREELDRLRVSLGNRLERLASSGPERVARHIWVDPDDTAIAPDSQ